MLYKLILGGVAVTVLAGFLLGSEALSYLSTSCERVTASVKESVPIEFQIDRARKMVRDLEPDIRRSMHVIAKEETEVEHLDEQIRTGEKKNEQGQIGNHASAVGSEDGEISVSICGKPLYGG